MRFIIHGATNWGSSNFGDFIYGNEIFEFLSNLEEKNNVSFYQPSDYFIKYINGLTNSKEVSLKDADFLVYIPGGYFGEGHNAKLVDVLIQSWRFMPFGLLGLMRKKKIIIIGVGAGPIKHLVMKWPISKICSKSKLITTRDEISTEALEKLEIKNIRNHGDMILGYDLENKAIETKQTNTIHDMAQGKKVLLIHYNHSMEALEKFAQTLNRFSQERNDFFIVVASDQLLEYEEQYYEKFKLLVNTTTYHFLYDNPFEMLQLLKISDVVLTCKLHVGVVAAMFNKSVVCAAEHPEKTKRFYEQIKYENRCVSLYDTEPNELSSLLIKNCDTPMHIPEEVVAEAKLHWVDLKEAIKNEK